MIIIFLFALLCACVFFFLPIVGAEVMVPLTQSLMIPGRLTKTNAVLVDIGTGFYVEKTTDQATNFCERKADMLEQQCSQLHTEVEQTRSKLHAVETTMQQKMAMSQ